MLRTTSLLISSGGIACRRQLRINKLILATLAKTEDDRYRGLERVLKEKRKERDRVILLLNGFHIVAAFSRAFAR